MAERGALKGRLAEVYVPALVDGSLEALARRLGTRATVDDPLLGRATTLAAIEPLLAKTRERLQAQHARYRHVATTSGVDRDMAEGVLTLELDGVTRTLPIAVVAERRRLREIELRLYHASLRPERWPRLPGATATGELAVPQIVAHVLDGLRRGAVERILAAFEEGSRWIDPLGEIHAKRDGAMDEFVSNRWGRRELAPIGLADDGRTCCVEAVVSRPARAHDEPEALTMAFERGDSGLVRELRLYYEP